MIHRGKTILMTADFSLKITEVRRMWNRILKHAKKQTINPEFYTHPAKTSLLNEGITFNHEKLIDFIVFRLAVKELLKEVLHTEGNQYQKKNLVIGNKEQKW